MILNIGCGGRPGDKMITYGDVRIDIESFPQVTHICDAQELPDEWTGKFEKIVCYTVLEHLENPFKALCEMSRTLTEGGIIEIVVPNVYHWRRIRRNYKSNIDLLNPETKLPDHKQAWDLTEMRNITKQIGLKLIKVSYLDWLPEKKRKSKSILSRLLYRFLPPIFTETEVKFVLSKI